MLNRYTSDKELLITALRRLKQNYYTGKSHTTTNPLREKQIKLLEALSANKGPQAHEILVGACHFVAKSIEAEYSSWVWPLNDPHKSDLYRLIQEVLDETDSYGKASEQHTCIYLIHFVNYLQQQKIFPELQAKAIDCAKKAKQQIQPKIQFLLKRPPTLVTLMQQFDSLPGAYEDLCRQDSHLSHALSYVGVGGRNSKRQQSIALTKLLIARRPMIEIGSADSEPSIEAKEEEYLLRYGALIYIMTQIESQYSLLSPGGGWITNGSQLYKLCQSITNISHSSDLDKLIKKEELSLLLSYISTQLAEEPGQGKRQHHLNLERIQDEITDQLSFLKNSKNVLVSNPSHNSLLNRFCRTVAQTTAQLGVGYGLAQLINGMVFADLSLTTLFTAAAPQYAFLVLGLVWLQNQFRSQCLATIAYPVVPAIEGVCRTVIRAPIEYCTSGRGLFSSKPTPITEDELLLLKTLSTAPDAIFSKAEKQTLTHVFNLKHEEERIRKENECVASQMFDGWEAVSSCQL